MIDGLKSRNVEFHASENSAVFASDTGRCVALAQELAQSPCLGASATLVG